MTKQVESIGYALGLEARGFIAEANELRRLRALNQELLKALKIADAFCGSLTSDVCSDSVHIPIRDAIKKAEAI